MIKERLALDMLHVAEVRALLQPRVRRMPNVVGIGTGLRRVQGKLTDDVVMTVMVIKKIPRSRIPSGALIPSVVRIHSPYVDREVDVGIDVVETGPHFPNRADPHRERHRPVPGGVSIGAFFPAASISRDGTGGGWVWSWTCMQAVLLSNAHVIAMDNSNNFPPLPVGCSTSDIEVYQPGFEDAGWEMLAENRIGYTLRWIPFTWETAPFTPCDNVADAAVALPDDIENVRNDILHLGRAVYETVAPLPGMEVSKCGRTTGDTMGVIDLVDVTLGVIYGSQNAFLTGQFLVGKRDPTDPPLTGSGDSGALWVCDEFVEGTEEVLGEGIHPVVGLHFGSNLDGTVADATPIRTVMDALHLGTLCEGAIAELIRGLDIIIGISPGADTVQRQLWQFRQFRSRMRQTNNGQMIDKMLARYPDVLFEALVLNPETQRLAIRIAEPLLRGMRNVRELELKKITGDMVSDIEAFLRCVGKMRPDAKDALQLVSKLTEQLEGRTIAEILGLPDPCSPRKR